MPAPFVYEKKFPRGGFEKNEAELLAKIRAKQDHKHYCPCAFYCAGTMEEKEKYLADYFDMIKHLPDRVIIKPKKSTRRRKK